MQSIVDKFWNNYASRQKKVRDEENRHVFQFGAPSESNVPIGHPAEFLESFVRNFEYLVREDISGVQEYFTSHLVSNQKDSIHDVSDKEEARINLLSYLKTASILTLWPNNNGFFTTNIGTEFQCFIMSIANSYSVHAQLVIDNWMKLNTGKVNEIHLPMLTFVMTVHLYVLQVFSNSLNVHGLSIDDNLPSHPWSFNEIDSFIDGSFTNLMKNENKNGRVAEVQAPHHLTPLKSDFFAAFVREGCYTYLFNITKQINRVIKDFIIRNQDELHQNPLILKFLIHLLIVQAEGLSFLVISINSAANTLPADLNNLIPLAEFIDTLSLLESRRTPILESLLIRIFLIILRLNSLFISVNNGDVASSNIPLRPKDISKIFIWFHRQFDILTAEDFSEITHSSESLTFSIQYKQNVGSTATSHDLWPWKSSGNTELANLVNVEPTAGSFHVLSKDVANDIIQILQAHNQFSTWDSIIAEVLGSQFLLNSRPQSSGVNFKVSAKRIRYTFEAFYEMLRDPVFHENSSPISFRNTSSIPLGQLKFVHFISQVFKAAEASDIFAILSEYETFRLLLGEKFLLSSSQLPAKFHEYFKIVKTEKETAPQISLIYSGLNESKYFSQFVWFLLHDRIMDYFHGLVIYSLYFQNSSSPSQSKTPETYLGYEDIMLVLTQYALSLTKSSAVSGGYVVYRISKLLTNLYEIVCSMAVNGSKNCRDKIIIQMFETLESLLLIRVTSNAPSNSESTIISAAANCAVDLLLHILSPGVSNGYDWIDVFVLDDKFMQIDISSEIQLRSPKRSSSSRSSRVSTRSTSDRPTSERPGGERSCRMRSTVYPLLLLLLEEPLYQSSLQIIQYILVGCAEAIHVLDLEDMKLGEGTNRRKKQNFRSLGAEVVNIIFGFLSVSHKHSNINFSVNVLKTGLNGLLYLLRDEHLHHLRIHIQEFIRRENLLYEFLKAFARSLYGFDSRPKTFTEGSGLSRSFPSTSDLAETCDSEPQPKQVEILRLGLAFLTSAVSGNDASKNELRLLLQTSKEKLVAGRVRFATTFTDGKDKPGAAPLSNKAASKLTSLILCAERSPAKDTIVVLLDLILEGPSAGEEFVTSDNKSEPLFSTDSDRPKIRNTSVLQDYFQLIPSCAPDVQQFAIRSFINLIRGRASLINQNVCSAARPKVIDIALDMMEVVSESIQSISAELIELLGRHSVSVASLKHLFRKLQTDTGARPVYAWKIIQALQGMFHQDPGPKHTFVFDGFSSGLRLPTIYKWPTMKGFSFCCWVRVESPRNNLKFDSGSAKTQKQRNYFPYILCLRDSQNIGLELFLSPSQEESKYRIVLRFLSETGESSNLSPDSPKLRLNEGQWYFLAIALAPNSFYSKGEALVKLNSYFHKSEFSFTKLPDKIQEPTIGDAATEFRKDYVGNTLRGQMGAMYFFNEVLSDKQLADIHSLGPDYVYNFEPFSADYKDLTSSSNKFNSFHQTQSVAYSILENGVLTSKILLAFNPVVLRGKYFLDNTPERNEVKWRVPHNLELSEDIKSESTKYCNMHAVRLSGTYRSTTQDVRLAINSLGGIRAIIPLFAQIDQQLPQPVNSSPSTLANSKSSVSTSGNNSNVNNDQINEYDPNFFPAVLGLFTTMVEENPENIIIFSKCGGFTSIRNLLDKASSANFNLITFNQLIGLYSRLGIEISLQESCMDNVLSNFKLWCNSSVDVQLALFDWLVETFDTNSQKFPYLFTVQKFLDSFYQYYDYSTANLNLANNSAFNSSLRQSFSNLNLTQMDSSASLAHFGAGSLDIVNSLMDSASNPFVSSSPRTLMMVNLINQSSSHLFHDDLKLIRGKLFSLIKLSILKKSTNEYEDILAIMKYLGVTTHSTAQQEILLLLISLLHSTRNSRRHNILLGILWGNCFSIFEYLYFTADETVRLLILWTVSNLMFYINLEKDAIAQLSQDLSQKIVGGSSSNQNQSVSKSVALAGPGGSGDNTNIPTNSSANNSGSTGPGFPSASQRFEGGFVPGSIQNIIDFQPTIIRETDLELNGGVFSGLPNLINLILATGDDLNKSHAPYLTSLVLFSIMMGKLPAELRDIVNQKILRNARFPPISEDEFTYYSFTDKTENKRLVFSNVQKLVYPSIYFTVLSQVLTYTTVNDSISILILDDFFEIIRNQQICEQIFEITPNWYDTMSKALNSQYNHYLSLLTLSKSMSESNNNAQLYISRALSASKLLRIACHLTSTGLRIGKTMPAKQSRTPAGQKTSSIPENRSTKSHSTSPQAVTAHTPAHQHDVYASIMKEERGFGAILVKEFIHSINLHVSDASIRLYIVSNILTVSVISLKEIAQLFYSSEFTEEHLNNFTAVKMKSIWILGVTIIEHFDKIVQFRNDVLVSKENEENMIIGNDSPDIFSLWSQLYPQIFEEFPLWLKRLHNFFLLSIPSVSSAEQPNLNHFAALNEATLFILKNFFDFFYSNIDYDNHFSNYRSSSFQFGSYELQLRNQEPIFEDIFLSIDFSRIIYAESNTEFSIGNNLWLSIRLLMKFITTCHDQFHAKEDPSNSLALENSQFLIGLFLLVHQLLKKVMTRNPKLHIFESMRIVCIATKCLEESRESKQKEMLAIMLGEYAKQTSKEFNSLLRIYGEMSSTIEGHAVGVGSVLSKENLDGRLDVLSKVLSGMLTSNQIEGFVRYQSHSPYPSSYDLTAQSTALTVSNLVPSSLVAVLDKNGVIFGEKSDHEKMKLWSAITKYILDFGNYIEEEILIVRMVDYGLKDQLLHMEGMISSSSPRLFPAQSIQKSTSSGDLMTSLSSLQTISGANTVNYDLIAFLSISESRRLSELMKQLDYNNRRSEKRWTRIFSQLANERGPWGYAAESRRREVYWTLDGLENDLRLRLRLKRNPFGTRHGLATMKSEGKESFVEESNILSGINSNSNNDRNIYADLKKYKKANPNSNMLIDDQGDDDKDTVTVTDAGNNSDNEDENNEDTVAGNKFFDTETIVVACEVITAATNPSGGKTLGKFECTKTRVAFNRQSENKDFDFINKTGNNEFLWAVECYPSTAWSSQEVCGVYRRHYQLRYVAIEIFFTNRTSIFINFIEKAIAKRVYRFLTTRIRAPNLANLFVGRPIQAITRVDPQLRTTITQAWVNRKISNFDYLLLLNFIAGRTFNDLAQYPVFPWVLTDYSSSKLDLKDPSIYRNFEYPIGAQAETQRAIMQDKYESCLQLQDDGIYPYHTGSHYSTSAMVIWYLLRMEPFTSYHVWLQDGKFDRPDRLFYSIQHTYRGCISNTQDVKELVPEFFFNPEFLYNTNNCQFGFRQTSEEIGDVILPNWARDASEFVRIHREALESEYVSMNLHRWIDLVFGSRQRPPFVPNGSKKAVESCNVFVHLSYVDAVDLEAMKSSDPNLYNRTVRQIDCYGQTPIQLFTKDHPKRKTLEEINDLIWPIASTVLGADTKPRLPTFDSPNSGGSKHGNEEYLIDKPAKVLCYGEFKVTSCPIVFLGAMLQQERLITVDTSRVLGYHTFQPRQPDNVPPFNMKLDRIAFNQSTGQQSGKPSSKNALTSYLPYTAIAREKVIGIPFAASVVLASSIIDRPATLDNEIESLIGTRQNKVKYHEEESKLRNMKRNNELSVRMLKTPVKPGASTHASHTPHSTSVQDNDYSNSRGDSSNIVPFSQVHHHRSVGFGNLSIINPSEVHADPAATLSPGPTNPLAGPASSLLPKKERIDEHIGSHMFCMLTCNVTISTIPSVTKTFQYIFSCGHWDNTFKITLADTGRLVQSLSYHREVVTCITTVSDFGKHWVIVGSKDCTITIWELFPEREGEPLNASPVLTLYGHDDAINCIAASAELDVIASGSDDGTIIIHTLREGIYLRSITFGKLSHIQLKPSSSTPPGQTPTTPLNTGPSGSEATTPNPSNFSPQQLDKDNYRIHMLVISKEGNLVAYSHDGYMLAAYTLNGRYLRMISVREKLHAMCLSEDGHVILTGGERGLIILRWVHNLMIANNGARKGLDSIIDGSSDSEFEPFPSAIRSMILTAQEQHLIVGLESGEIRILAQVSPISLFF